MITNIEQLSGHQIRWYSETLITLTIHRYPVENRPPVLKVKMNQFDSDNQSTEYKLHLLEL